MSIKSFIRWFIGDDKPESERGLFNHFNRPESLPWPPVDGPIVGNRPKQFRPPVTDQDILNSSAAFYDEERRKHLEWLKTKPFEKPATPVGGSSEMVPCPAHLCNSDIGFCGLCGTTGHVRRETANQYWASQADRGKAAGVPTGKAVLVDGEYKPTFREPAELKPTVGSVIIPMRDAPPKRVPHIVRPQRVVDAILVGDTHPDVYEYLVHLEAHFVRTAHHG